MFNALKASYPFSKVKISCIVNTGVAIWLNKKGKLTNVSRSAVVNCPFAGNPLPTLRVFLALKDFPSL